MSDTSLALLEIGNLTPALVAADCCAKAAGVRILGIESTMEAGQCIKLVGSAGNVREACLRGAELARRMGTTVAMTILPGPLDETLKAADPPRTYVPMLDLYDS